MMSKIKVLIIPQAEISVNGGVWRHCYSLKKLFEQDDKIIVDILDLNKVCVKPLPLPGKKYYYSISQLYKQIKTTNCNIVHIHGFISFASVESFLICWILRKKCVYSPHFHPFIYLERPLFGILFYKLLISPFKRIVRKVVTINITDSTYFTSKGWSVQQIPHHYPINSVTKKERNPKSKHILFVGRNDSNKGLNYINSIPKEYTIHCVTDKIAGIIHPNIVFHNNVKDSDLIELYKESSLVIIPSRYEAFSYVALESLINGTPVLASDRVEIGSYLIESDGYTTFRYGDINDFIAKLPIAASRNVNVERIKSIFSPQRIRDAYKKIYENCV